VGCGDGGGVILRAILLCRLKPLVVAASELVIAHRRSTAFGVGCWRQQDAGEKKRINGLSRGARVTLEKDVEKESTLCQPQGQVTGKAGKVTALNAQQTYACGRGRG
jgi:hypothetical protein